MSATELPGRSAVVLVIDRLGAGWLSPYGNTWLDGPNFNRLAARSVLCETLIADSPDLEKGCHAYWTGRHALEPSDGVAATLAALASSAGGQSLLLTDDSRVCDHPLASGFADRRLLPVSNAAKGAKEIEQTGLFAFFEAARAAVEERKAPGLLWLHSRGMSGQWDAPPELRYQFADEEDPTPPSFVDPPEVQLNENFDPDELLGYVHAYAGQVALVDMCLGMLLDAIDEHPLADETLLIVTSPRGYPLGEHRRVGSCDEALFGELLHVPLLVQFPRGEHALTRSHQIIQPGEIFSLVSEACGWRASDSMSKVLGAIVGKATYSPGLACAAGREQRAIRTPAWFLRESQIDGQPQFELFAKPDDRWEANEVSSRCGDVVELLAAELDRFEAAARAGRLTETTPLPEILCEMWR
jgi:hypothetical protein